jgi:hypothetical protein
MIVKRKSAERRASATTSASVSWTIATTNLLISGILAEPTVLAASTDAATRVEESADHPLFESHDLPFVTVCAAAPRVW